VAKCFWNDINRYNLHAWWNQEPVKSWSQILLSSRCITTGRLKHNKTITLSTVVCGYETWYITFSTEYWLKIFEYRILTKIFGSKRSKQCGFTEKSISKNFFICVPHQNIIRMIDSRTMRWAGNVTRMGETESVWFLWRNLKKRDILEDSARM